MARSWSNRTYKPHRALGPAGKHQRISIKQARYVIEKAGLSPKNAYKLAYNWSYESGGQAGKWINPGQVSTIDAGVGPNQATPTAWDHNSGLYHRFKELGGRRGQRNSRNAALLAKYDLRHGDPGWALWTKGIRGTDPQFAAASARVAGKRVGSVLGKFPNAGGGGRSASSPGRRRAGHRTVSSLSRVPGTDNSAVRQAVLQQFALSGAHDTTSLLQLATDLKDAKDVPGSSTSSSRTYGVNAGRTNGTRKGKGIKAPSSGGVHGQGFYFKHPGQATKLHGTAMFDGQKIASWIKPALVYARRHGWKGGINSGFRTDAEQTRIYNSGVRPAAVPRSLGGSGSNHEGANFPRGAVDVSDAATLSSILLRSPYRHLLIYAGSKDPVHFSHPHNGGY